MEGKFIRSLRANRVEIIGVLFFVICLVAAIALILYFFKAPFRSPIIVEKKDGAFIVADKQEGRSIALPKTYTKQPYAKTLDFFTDTVECRITVEHIDMPKEKTIEEWIAEANDQLAALTVLDMQVERLIENGTRVLYTLLSEETGLSKIYYEKRSGYLFAMRVFGENEICYTDFEFSIREREV